MGLKKKAANVTFYLMTNDNGVKSVVMRMRLGGCVDPGGKQLTLSEISS